jgi:hypothetical protein
MEPTDPIWYAFHMSLLVHLPVEEGLLICVDKREVSLQTGEYADTCNKFLQLDAYNAAVVIGLAEIGAANSFSFETSLGDAFKRYPPPVDGDECRCPLNPGIVGMLSPQRDAHKIWHNQPPENQWMYWRDWARWTKCCRSPHFWEDCPENLRHQALLGCVQEGLDEFLNCSASASDAAHLEEVFTHRPRIGRARSLPVVNIMLYGRHRHVWNALDPSQSGDEHVTAYSSELYLHSTPIWYDCSDEIALLGDRWTAQDLILHQRDDIEWQNLRAELDVLIHGIGERSTGNHAPAFWARNENISKLSAPRVLPTLQRLFQIVNGREPEGGVSATCDCVLLAKEGMVWLTERPSK